MAKRIMVVDDAAFMRMTLKNILQSGGYEVCGEAESGAEAVKRYEELKPDLVTMDIVMLDQDGIQASKGILEKDPQAKILIVSAMGQQHLIVEAIQTGAKGFIIKPFNPNTVLQEVKRILGE